MQTSAAPAPSVPTKKNVKSFNRLDGNARSQPDETRNDKGNTHRFAKQSEWERVFVGARTRRRLLVRIELHRHL